MQNSASTPISIWGWKQPEISKRVRKSQCSTTGMFDSFLAFTMFIIPNYKHSTRHPQEKETVEDRMVLWLHLRAMHWPYRVRNNGVCNHLRGLRGGIPFTKVSWEENTVYLISCYSYGEIHWILTVTGHALPVISILRFYSWLFSSSSLNIMCRSQTWKEKLIS